MDSCVFQEQLPLRDETEHFRRCAHLEQCSTKKNEKNYWSTHYGINNASALRAIPHFRLTECFLHDPQHDFEEGVLPLVMKLLLKYLVSHIPQFSLRRFNDRIRYFPWTPQERSDIPSDIEPAHLDSSSSLKLTAQKSKNLAMRFPALAADLFPHGDPKWKNFCLLRQIYVLVTAPIASDRTLQFLEFLISSFLITFKECYPLALFTPKLHYMLHYVLQIYQFGPGRNHSCKKFERQFMLLKSKKWRNFKNTVEIPKLASIGK